MPVEVIMPKVDMDMTTGTIASWHIDEGAAIEKGAPLFDIETDKATMEVESPATGALHFIAARGGDVVEIGTCVAWIFTDGENVQRPEGQTDSDAVSSPAIENPQDDNLLATKAINDEKPAPVSTNAATNSTKEGIRATPLARRIAQQNNIDLRVINGSGPRGRITRADVEASHQSITDATPASNTGSSLIAYLQSEGIAFDKVPVDRMRQTIAKRLTASKSSVPHFYLETDCRLERLLEYRQEVNEVLQQSAKKISLNDLLVRACAQALIAVPEANASWDDEHIIRYTDANVAIAVSVDGGVVTPVIRQAQRKLINEISAESASLIERARRGVLTPAEYQGGSFTLSNLGMYDIKSFSAIINPPQSMILAAGSMQRIFLPDENDHPCATTVMSVVLSCDHRIVDGVLGAKWLAEFKRRIEHPVLLGMDL